MNKIYSVILAACLLLSVSFINSFAKYYIATNQDYKPILSLLLPGDTLLLSGGTYPDGLRLSNINGSEGNYIVITGEEGNRTQMTGKEGVNTISITKCSYLKIMNLNIDGLNLPVDAVKAEGTTGNYAHHITLENLNIINYGVDQQIVGISTKCPAWDWVIRMNTIVGAGTGLYLGNSDGTMPFINGIIEYNLVINTIGYNMQVKHQNEGLRTVPGMTLNGKTIIRYNVFSKAQGGSTGSNARPCLLVGNFPATGDGMNDYYEIYGNFFWQNPNEALFQGTGNIALYSNIFVNTFDPSGVRAVYITQQNSFKPRNIAVFHNTLWAKNSSGGIRLYSADTSYRQFCFGNAAFAATPVSNFKISYKNITDTYENGNIYLNYLTDIIGQLDCYPVIGKLEQDTIDMTLISKYTDYDKDFDGNFYNTIYRGAYSGAGQHTGWKLALELRPELGPPTSALDINSEKSEFSISPNPASDYIEINIPRWRWGEHHSVMFTVDNQDAMSGIRIFNLLGVEITTPSLRETPPYQGGEIVRIDVSALSHGVYFVRIENEIRKFIKM